MPKPLKTSPYPFANTIGREIREAKSARGLSDIKFAQRTGISRRHLVEFQKGSNATLLIAFKAMRALGIRELVHDFEGETLTLSITDTPARIHPATLIETAELLERVVRSLLQAALTLRDAAAVKPAADPAVASSGASGNSLSRRAAAVIGEFGRLFHELDADTKVDVLAGLTQASTASHSNADQLTPAPARKGKSKAV